MAESTKYRYGKTRRIATVGRQGRIVRRTGGGFTIAWGKKKTKGYVNVRRIKEVPAGRGKKRAAPARTQGSFAAPGFGKKANKAQKRFGRVYTGPK